jgi:hypothetical protein
MPIAAAGRMPAIRASIMDWGDRTTSISTPRLAAGIRAPHAKRFAAFHAVGDLHTAATHAK